MDRIEIIERYIVEELMKAKAGTRVPPDQSLFDEGILDSLGVLQLISFIEDRFGVKVEDTEIERENFETLNAMNALLARKLDGGTD
jgi:D-alanine--poly(phosphoribitol) ligase subunit 2